MNSLSIIGLLLLIAPVMKSVAEGVFFPVHTSRKIFEVDLKKQSASSVLPSFTVQLSALIETVHFSTSSREK